MSTATFVDDRVDRFPEDGDEDSAAPTPCASTIGPEDQEQLSMRPLKEFGLDYSSTASIGSQNVILSFNLAYNAPVYICTPVPLRSSFIRSARISVDFHWPILVTGSVRILSVPRTFSAPLFGCTADDFVAVHPLSDISGVEGKSVYHAPEAKYSNKPDISDKMLVVMRGNVASDVTCLYTLPLRSTKGALCHDDAMGFLSCEGLDDLGYEVPSDRQIIILLAAFVNPGNVYGTTVKTHLFVNFR
ncbi:hypothetical protein TWF481_007104 [Arthrobotrys musiformis]|uniref:Uncharacterized protein n=1 Tax=Arthrobotrys musiformis TaxID=47236 RepID=A0AAV9WAG5_9PEZI